MGFARVGLSTLWYPALQKQSGKQISTFFPKIFSIDSFQIYFLQLLFSEIFFTINGSRYFFHTIFFETSNFLHRMLQGVKKRNIA
jgi:hypothetical protein